MRRRRIYSGRHYRVQWLGVRAGYLDDILHHRVGDQGSSPPFRTIFLPVLHPLPSRFLYSLRISHTITLCFRSRFHLSSPPFLLYHTCIVYVTARFILSSHRYPRTSLVHIPSNRLQCFLVFGHSNTSHPWVDDPCWRALTFFPGRPNVDLDRLSGVSSKISSQDQRYRAGAPPPASHTDKYAKDSAMPFTAVKPGESAYK